MVKPPIATQTVPPAGASNAQAPFAGQVIDEKYRVDRVIGKGGMGLVLAVTHLQLDEPYAMKCLLPDVARDAETVARFLREAKASVRMKSEHVARVSDVGQLPDGSPYMVMELLAGRDVGDVLAERGTLTVADTIDYVLQACVGLAEAHARGIIHRDLKPSNLFLTERLDGAPLVKVLDFGISKVASDVTDAIVTHSHAIFGSPAYMSPEQLRSSKSVDARTDIWSLGVIVFRLLTGHAPFKADTWPDLLSAILLSTPKPLRELRPELSAELENVISKCLEKDPARRFQNVAELAVALEHCAPTASRVSIGRISRLVKQGSAIASRSEGASRRASLPDANSGTAAPWVSQPSASGTSNQRWKMFVAGALLSGVIGGAAAVLFQSTSTPRSEPRTGTAAAGTSSAFASPSALPSPWALASDSVPPPRVSASIGTAIAPAAAAASSVPSASQAVPLPGKPRVRAPRIAPPKPELSATPPAPVSSAPRPGASPIDPTAESH